MANQKMKTPTEKQIKEAKKKAKKSYNKKTGKWE